MRISPHHPLKMARIPVSATGALYLIISYCLVCAKFRACWWFLGRGFVRIVCNC